MPTTAPQRPSPRPAWRWPRQCPLCRDWTAQALCSACLSRFAAPRPRCRRCGLGLAHDGLPCPACVHEAPPFERCLCAGDYGFPWDRMITALKFQGRTELAAPLALALASSVMGGDAPAADLVLPVPLSASRLAERGHNQSWEIARRAARMLALPAAPGVLVRLRDTAHQVGLSRRERLHNLREAVMVEPAQAARVTGRRIALVDDVLTTGATAAACAEVLLRAGATAVQAWVVARTPPPDER